jgi:hypothetical protein
MAKVALFSVIKWTCFRLTNTPLQVGTFQARPLQVGNV